MKRRFLYWAIYWLGALVPKRKNLWVFSYFRGMRYMDNTRYLFEWVSEKHPEIEAVWMTRNPDLAEELVRSGKRAVLQQSRMGRWLMLRAGVAFTEHYRCAAYEPRYGFNARSRVVQLWHGVGPKSMVPADGKIPSCAFAGVRLSDDLLPQAGEGFATRLAKLWAYIRHAHNRELPERYFGFLCPGPQHQKFMAGAWHTPASAFIHAGYPRNLHLHQTPASEKTKILYAPTFRWNVETENMLRQSFAEAIEQIAAFLERYDAELVLRLHPGTRQKHERFFQEVVAPYSRISFDMEEDCYKTLGQYALVISDYSSIAFDFTLLDRPMVFYAPDIDTYNEVVFDYPIAEICPGPIVKTWAETLQEAEKALQNPGVDAGRRHAVRDEFYDMSVNDAQNAERITVTIKHRLHLN